MPRKKLFNVLICLAIISIAVLSLWLINGPRAEEYSMSKISAVKMRNISVSVDLATTPAELAQGLSGREPLGPEKGMLFIFKTPDTYGFWMKDMKFSLDIIWIDENFKITYIKEDLKPDSFPEVYKPSEKSLYVLEVNSGFIKNNGLKVGDEITFLKN